MGSFEPADQQVGSFVWSLAVERHESPRATGETDQIGPPAMRLNGENLDLVNVPVDGLFESVCVHDAELPGAWRSMRSGKRRFYREQEWRQAKRYAKTTLTAANRRGCLGIHQKKSFRSLRINIEPTAFQHFLHSLRDVDGCGLTFVGRRHYPLSVLAEPPYSLGLRLH